MIHVIQFTATANGFHQDRGEDLLGCQAPTEEYQQSSSHQRILNADILSEIDATILPFLMRVDFTILHRLSLLRSCGHACGRSNPQNWVWG
jgi:hypothetical protein